MTAILETRGLEYVYPDGTIALRGVSVVIRKGCRVAFLGVNGAGKSTLLLHFAGILRPTAGEVLFRGMRLRYDRRSLASLRRSVGIVFQNPEDQLFAPTVAQDVGFGPRNLGMCEDEVRSRVRRALRIVGMEGLADRPPHLLSHGQKKRVAIAGILAMEPEVVILDEPLSGLDPPGREKFVELLDELARERTVVVATHNVDFAYEWADYAYVMREGRVVAQGKPAQVFAELRGIPSPRLLELHEALVENGLADGRVPRCTSELVRSVASLGVRLAEASEPLEAGEELVLRARRGRVEAVRGYGGGRVLDRAVNGGLLCSGRLSRDTELLLLPIDSAEHTLLLKEVKRVEVDVVAALGSEAQLALERLGIEGCLPRERWLTKLMAGYRVLLLLPGRMVAEVCRRVRGVSGVRVRVLRGSIYMGREGELNEGGKPARAG